MVCHAAAAQPTCDADFNGGGGGAFTQTLCESSTFGGGAGFVLSSPLPSGACGESCAATTSEQTDIDACAAITLTGTDYTGGVGTDRRDQCEGTPAPCQYTPPTTCTAAICCDGEFPPAAGLAAQWPLPCYCWSDPLLDVNSHTIYVIPRVLWCRC